jgi:mannose-6-phosphate isomerase-like protein (cupin superfamily)
MASLTHRPYIADHSVDPPDHREADGAPTWVTRGANFVIAVTRVREGTRLSIDNVPDEHMVLLADATASIASNGEQPRNVPGNHLVIAPPGMTQLVAHREGWVVRCFSARATALLDMARNAWGYIAPNAAVAPMEAWPAPAGGFALKVHDLEAGVKDGDKTRVYRSSNLMINVLCERTAARDTRLLSPHSHADFEQGSITVKGTHVHHLRTPWTPDMGTWRPDEAAEVGAPSVTVIPPGIVHTTRNIGDAPALLVDLFCPPRRDFALRPGMVRNADDYPLPPDLEGAQ